VKRLSTLPTTGEQARHALLLLGAPAGVRLVAEVHGALFDGDLSTAALVRLIQAGTVGFCVPLRPDLTAIPAMVALAEWPIEQRILTPAGRRAGELAMIVRVAEFVAMRRGAGRAADRLLRELAQRVPHGVEAFDLAEAARNALADASLTAAQEAETPLREAAAARAAALDVRQQLFGVPAVPHQRGGG
jgi:hypothetical protein